MKHISHRPSCKKYYTKLELQEFDKWTNEGKALKKFVNYDPSKQRQKYLQNKATIAKKYQDNKAKIAKKYQDNKAIIAKKYHEQIGKFKEKPKDRCSLKWRSFAKIYDEAYKVALDSFFNTVLIKKAEEFLFENERVHGDIFESIFYFKSWAKSAAPICISQNHENIRQYHKDLNQNLTSFEIPPCSTLKTFPCAVTEAYEKALKKNIPKIANYIADNSWENPWQPEFRHKEGLSGKLKDIIYKEVFASFYHAESFLSIYNETHDNCLSSIMKFDPDVYYPGFGKVEYFREKAFEKKVFEEILVASKESVMNDVSAFVFEEIKVVVEFHQKEKYVWRRWLDLEKQNFGSILSCSGYAH